MSDKWIHDVDTIRDFVRNEVADITQRATAASLCPNCMMHSLAGLIVEMILIGEGLDEEEIMKRKRIIHAIVQGENQVVRQRVTREVAPDKKKAH
jgi:hypothetical protein